MLGKNLPTVTTIKRHVSFGLGFEVGGLSGGIETGVRHPQKRRADPVALSLRRDAQEPEIGMRPLHRMVLVHVGARGA